MDRLPSEDPTDYSCSDEQHWHTPLVRTPAMKSASRTPGIAVRRRGHGSERKPSSVPFPRLAVWEIGMVICLGWPSPATSSSLPAAPCVATEWAVWVTPRRLFGLAPTGGCRAPLLALGAVGSYPTVSPLPHPSRDVAVCFLWPVPSPCGAQALPGSLPDGARTFLGRARAPPRPSLPTRPR